MAMRGTFFAVMLLSFSVMLSFVIGIGFGDTFGVRPEPHLDDQRGDLAGEFGGDLNVSNADGETFFGINVQSGSALGTFSILFKQASSILQWFWVPAPLANPIQEVIVIFGGLMVYQYVRGFNAE